MESHTPESFCRIPRSFCDPKPPIINMDYFPPAGMLADRSYAGVVIAPPPAERIDSLENRSDSVGS